MTSPTIKPPNAISIWVENNLLIAELPTPDGKLSHYLRLPLNYVGLNQLVDILKVRRPDSKFAEPGDPNQWQVEKDKNGLTVGKVTRIGKPSFAPHLHDAARAILRRMGIS